MAQLQEIPVELIILPDEIMRRETMNQEMKEFIEDIAARGLIQPIGVTSLPDGRYRIRWGARRTLAHRLMSRKLIPAMVHTEDEADELDDMARENYQRVQVSDGEDVRFLCRYMKEKNVSASEAARRLRVPYARVLRAQAISGGDEQVIEALYDGRITAAVAEELVQIPTNLHRTNLLFHAIKTQCSAKFIRVWREQLEVTGQTVNVEHVEQVIAQQSQINYASMLQCNVCQQFHDYMAATVRGVCHTCWGALMELKDQAMATQVENSQEVNGAEQSPETGPT